MKNLIVLILLAFITFSCGNKNAEHTDSEEQKAQSIAASSEDGLIEDINQKLETFNRVESLEYSKEDGTNISVVAHLYDEEHIAKVEEEKLDGKTKLNSRTSFYYQNDVLFASKKLSEKLKGNTAYFSEEITFYSPDGKVKQSKERISDFEEYIANEEFRKIDPVSHSSEEAFNVLKQQGQFKTTFQGFVDSGPYHFLIVGENVENDGFTSALSIQKEDATLKFLRSEGQKAIGKELQVQFEKHMDNQGYLMQILIDVAIVERKK